MIVGDSISFSVIVNYSHKVAQTAGVWGLVGWGIDGGAGW